MHKYELLNISVINTAERDGEKAKAGLLKRLKELGLGGNVFLVIRRVQTSDSAYAVYGYTKPDLLLDESGILRRIETGTTEINGRQVPTVSHVEIPLEEYSLYAHLGEAAIQREIDSKHQIIK